ncbi:MAG TPA: toast rack family protein [Chloroflexia bacterium]
MDTNTRKFSDGTAARVGDAAPNAGPQPAYSPPAYAQPAYAPPAYVPGPPPVPRKRGLSPLVWVLLVLGMLLLLCGGGFVAMAAWITTTAVKVVGDIPTVVVGPLQTETSSIQLDGAHAVDVNLKMGAGNLTLAGGATNLLDGTFTYDVAAWKPEVTYQVNGSTGTLTVRQARENGIVRTLDHPHNEWDLHLQDDVPLTLTASMGAGESKLKLGSLNLTKLDLQTGAGTAMVDLTGNWKQNLTAGIEGGIGDMTVKLPRDAGVRVKVEHSGLGKVQATDLTVSGDTYTNAAYGHSPVTLDLTVQLGVGNITLEQAQ